MIIHHTNSSEMTNGSLSTFDSGHSCLYFFVSEYRRNNPLVLRSKPRSRMGILLVVNIAQLPVEAVRQDKDNRLRFSMTTALRFLHFEPMHGRIPGHRAADLLRYRMRRRAQGRGCELWLMGNQYHLGVGVSMAIYLSAGISGAHLNPAVSIALCIFADFESANCPSIFLPRSPAPFAPPPWCTRSTAICFSITNKLTTWSAAPKPAWNWRRCSPPIPMRCLRHGPGIPGGDGHHRHLMGVIMALTDDNNGLSRGPGPPC